VLQEEEPEEPVYQQPAPATQQPPSEVVYAADSYVDDLVDALLALMESAKEFTGPVNLGNPHECTMLELAERVIELTRSSSRIVFKPLPADDPRRRRPDISLARQHLGWQPRVPLEEGLAKTVEYFDDLLRR
jgi:UDP-glucuronate decarboxylase